MKINKIVIVGGGSSGWMTAAALCKQFPEMEITLIESKNIKTIGVGESTLFGINQYLSLLDIKDEDWMPECDATYKVSISFTDFREKGSQFQYPFGAGTHLSDEHSPLGLDTWPILRQLDREKNPPERFAQFYNPVTYLANSNKLTDNTDESIPLFDFKNDTAYHFDSTKFGIYLRDKICKPHGIEHILDEVKEIKKKSNGDIDFIVSESGITLTADLFIDCTGFKSLLLEETMESKFISYSETLLNDRALATKINYNNIETELRNYTNCTAIENGWVWNIPLWNRMGSGYVYSSKFVDRDQAEIEFRNHLSSIGQEISEDSEILDIKIKHGRHEKAWVGNVLAVGLSYGFIEPLESTGLFTTHENIYKFVKMLQRRDGFYSGTDVSMFNSHMALMLDTFRSFLEIHYALSMRDDTEYWKYVTSIEYKDNFDLEQIRVNTFMQSNFRGLKGGSPYIAAGMGYFPNYRFGSGLGEVNIGDLESLSNMQREFDSFATSMESYMDSLPSSYQFLKENIYS